MISDMLIESWLVFIDRLTVTKGILMLANPGRRVDSWLTFLVAQKRYL